MEENREVDVDFVVEGIDSAYYRLVRKASSRGDVLASLRQITEILRVKEYSGVTSKLLIKRQMATVAGCFLESFATEVIETHDTRSVELTDVCLDLLVCYSSLIDKEKITEKNWGKVVVTTLHLLGFAATFDSGNFKHSFPPETLKYLKTTQGRTFRVELKKLGTPDRAKLKKLLIDLQPEYRRVDNSPKYRVDLEVNSFSKTNLSEVVESGNLGCKLPSKNDVDTVQAFVRITHWSTPNFCWTQSVVEQTNTILRSIEEVASYRKLSGLVEQPRRGDIVLAMCEHQEWPHQKWIRGRVLKCAGSVSVFAMDYGFVRDFDPGKLYQLPQKLGEEPPIAVLCHFPVSPPMPSPRILLLGTGLLNIMCEANPSLIHHSITKSKNHQTLLSLLDCRFKTTTNVLKILTKLCGEEDYKRSAIQLNVDSLIFQTFREVYDQWMKGKTSELENSLIMCCCILDTLAKHMEFKNALEELSSLLVLPRLPPECKTILTRLFSSVSKVAVSSKEMEYKQGELLEKRTGGVHMVNESRTFGGIDKRNLEEAICALANHPQGGRITFGIIGSGHIIGMQLDQKDRDEFRLMVDQMTAQRIRPLIPHERLKVNFGQVDGAQNDLFVVNVDIVGMPLGVHSTHAARYMVCFPHGILRQMSANELKDMVASREEVKYLQEIEMLQATIRKLSM